MQPIPKSAAHHPGRPLVITCWGRIWGGGGDPWPLQFFVRKICDQAQDTLKFETNVRSVTGLLDTLQQCPGSTSGGSERVFVGFTCLGLPPFLLSNFVLGDSVSNVAQT